MTLLDGGSLRLWLSEELVVRKAGGLCEKAENLYCCEIGSYQMQILKLV